MDQPDDIEMVYGYLLQRLVQAARDGNDALRTRIYGAIETYEELWPTETERWRDRWSSSNGQQQD